MGLPDTYTYHVAMETAMAYLASNFTC